MYTISKYLKKFFWNQPLSSVILIARNNIAMDNWKHSEQEKESKKKRGKTIMAKQPESKVKFSVFNEEFNKAIKDMSANITMLNKEFKLEQEQLKRTGSEQDKLESSLKKLSSEHDIAKQKVSLAEKQLSEAKTMYGENSTEVNTLQKKVA
ncbi:phage protein [Listeria fleischmannii FSL S10-1203]|uniref:Phage protein n=1 Tax=Listeria fleischmannii FSL S10-1203 TaxID=1265822 RepID=W7DYN4_9LIST|nr:phage protein [Listeria fleischmannii FSL S10-1203]